MLRFHVDVSRKHFGLILLALVLGVVVGYLTADHWVPVAKEFLGLASETAEWCNDCYTPAPVRGINV